MAFKKKKAPTKVKYDQSLLDRIDNIHDDKEFSPYSATKRQTLSNQQAFDDRLYKEADDEDDDTDEYGIKKDDGNGGVIIVIALVAILIVGVAAFVIFM